MSQPNTERWCILPTPMGKFRMYDTGDEGTRLVSMGDIRQQGPKPLLRVHSSCMASETFGACDCDCADQLRESMKLIASCGRGLVIHLAQEGRGQGLSKKISAVGAMQRDGLDTAQAFEALGLEQDTRTYAAVVEILRSLGLDEVRLITNNPSKTRFLRQHGIQVETINTHPRIRPENCDYLQTKRAKFGHTFEVESHTAGDGDILFYHSDQPYGELSNFSAHAVFGDGRIWPTTEHYYQARKFEGTAREEQIRRCPTPMMAKQLAAQWRSLRREDWASVKEGVMLEALRAKFTQHPELRDLLVATGSRRLVEHTRLDAHWGDGGDGSGNNRLGVLLMTLRADLQAAATSASKAS